MHTMLEQLLSDPQTYVVAAALAALVAIMEYRVRAGVDSRFAKRLEDHRHMLDLAAEAAKFDLQRRLADFGLYAAKKHEAAGKIWEGLRVAHGAVTSLRGLTRESTMEDYNEEDLRTAFSGLRMPRGKQEEILAEWRKSPAAALASAQPYLRMLRVQYAERLLTEARNTIYLNELYLTDEVVAAIDPLVGALNDWMVHIELPPGPGEPRWLPDRKKMQAALEAAHTGLRAFISAGASTTAGVELGKLTKVGG
jgi:hypothetical protein